MLRDITEETETLRRDRFEVYFYVSENALNQSIYLDHVYYTKWKKDLLRLSCLWQVSSRSFKDIKAKENVWKEVAAKVRHTK